MSDISKITIEGVTHNLKDTIARETANGLVGRVNILENSDIIIIGDSYGVDSSAGGKSWASYVEELYPSCVRLTVGGTGFGSDVYIDENWLSMLENASVTDKSTVKDIYVIGGANDANLMYDGRLSASALTNRINSFCNYCATNYPNALVHIGFIGWYLDYDRFNTYTNTKNIYRQCALNNANASYINGVEYIMHNSGFINTDDYIHPIQEASTLLGTVICNVINSKSDCVNVCFSTTPILSSEHTCTEYNLYCVYVGNVAILNMVGGYSNYTFMRIRMSEGKQFNVGDTYIICELTNTPKCGKVPPSVHLDVYIGGAGGSIETVPCLIQMQDNKISIKNVSTTAMSDAQLFLIPSFQLVIPLENN